MVWTRENSEKDQSALIKHMIVPYTRGKGLDIGYSPKTAYPHMMGVGRAGKLGDMVRHDDIPVRIGDMSIFAPKALDFVYSCHLLQYEKDAPGLLRKWWGVIKPGGYLVLYLPHKNFRPVKGQKDCDENTEHEFVPDDIISMMKGIGSWDLVENQNRSEREEFSFFQVFKKLKGKKQHLYSYKALPVEKRLLCIRYGGIGDYLQISSVLPALKERGFHITVGVHPNGPDILGNNPNIDAFRIQDPDQVPNIELSDYWAALENEFDYCINFSESTEGTLLAMPGRRTHALPHKARHALMDINYVDFTHEIAKVPTYPHQIRFFPTDDERKEAEAFRKGLGDVPVVLWCLAGSSIHKAYPHTHAVVPHLLKNGPAKVVFVGDNLCQIIEVGVTQATLQFEAVMTTKESEEKKLLLSEMLEKLKEHWGENRIICKSGAWSIRQTLAFAEYADVVVGPETGVLNAVSMLKGVGKVIMLSHSSHENLTKYWLNTTALEPVDISCYPCHRLHYGSEFCPQHEDGGAKCAQSITPSMVYDAIVGKLIEGEKKERAA